MGESKTKKKSSRSPWTKKRPTAWVKYMQARLREMGQDASYNDMPHRDKMVEIGQDWAEYKAEQERLGREVSADEHHDHLEEQEQPEDLPVETDVKVNE